MTTKDIEVLINPLSPPPSTSSAMKTSDPQSPGLNIPGRNGRKLRKYRRGR